MSAARGAQLFDINAPSFEPPIFSSLDLFQKQNSFGFSPGTSPAPSDLKNEEGESFFDLDTRYTPVSSHSSLGFNEVGNKSSVKKNGCHTISPQSMQQASPLQIPSTTMRQRHGQLTPPSETTPTSERMPSEAPQENQTSPAETRSSQITRKRRIAQPSQVSEAPAQPVATPRRRRKSSRKQSSAESTADGDDKRSQFLERNRIAASKCRLKKKEWTSNLETRARELQASKNSLALLVSSLREELLYLKGEALRHTSCDCNHVREYLARHAETSLGHDGAYSPQFSSNLCFEAMDLDSMVMLDSPNSFVMTEDQSLPELDMMGQIPD